MADRRAGRRLQSRLRVWCEGDEFTLLSETGNVSQRGFFLRTSSSAPPAGPFKVTIEELGVVASVEARWAQQGQDAATPGVGVEIVGFERGAAAFREYVERLGMRSGEHRLSWPEASSGEPGAEARADDRGDSDDEP